MSEYIFLERSKKFKTWKNLKKNFENVKTFNLIQNYRSTQNILNFAYDVISKNQTHPILELFTDNNKGEEVDIRQVENEQYEGLFIAQEIKRLIADGYDYADIAILYRINAQSCSTN